VSEAPPPGARADCLQLLDGLIYADGFDCALTLDELWRYSRIPIGRDALERRLRDDVCLRAVVTERGGMYCLVDRTPLIGLRRERMCRASRLQRRALRVARLLRVAPFVRGVVLTGSVAADDAPAGADVDLLVVVAPRRLATVFLLLGTSSRLLGRQVFCPNYYVVEGHLRIDEANIYIAHELAQARILVGDAGLFGEADSWLATVFPNGRGVATRDPMLPASPRVQSLLELPLRGRLGDRLEHFARGIALSRLRAHYRVHGASVPADVRLAFDAGKALRFHRGQTEEKALVRYRARREHVEQALRAADRDQPEPSSRTSS
jgi:predicted nucleotidyltransferase